MGTAIGIMFVAGTSIVRKWLVAPELRMAHCLMFLHQYELFSEGLKLRGRSCGRGSNKKENLTSLFNLVVLLLLTPNHQKG
jgi:hypothetical protein